MKSTWILLQFASATALVLGVGCANISKNSDDDDSDDTKSATTGGKKATSNGGKSSSASGSTSSTSSSSTGSSSSTSTSNGSNTSMGGETSMGGAMSMGGDDAEGSDDPTLTGDCADVVAVSDFSGFTGDFAIFVCNEDRDSCLGVDLGEPALFECVSTHAPNCYSQQPVGGVSVWQYVALCSELGMGGAGGD